MAPLPTPHDLLFAYDFPPIGGGIARWMEGLARAFPPGTLQVSTGQAPEGGEGDPSFPNPVDRVPVPADRLRTLPGLMTWGRRANALAREPGTRFAWSSSLRPAAWPAWWARRRTGLPYGVILHGGDLLVLQRKLRREPWKRHTLASLVRRASVLVVNSRWTAEHAAGMLETLGVLRGAPDIRLISPGTDPAPWSTTPDAVRAFQMRRNLPDGPWLVSVSRLVPHKGVDTAIEVLAALRDVIPGLRYAAIGRGPHRAAFEARAREAGVADRVHFLSDVADAELPAAYGLASVVVGLSRAHATDIEGFGITFLEAAAAGRPVVAGASGGTADAVADGVTGILVPPTDVPAIAEAVARLLADPALRERMGRAGRERVIRQFTWERVAADFRAIAAERGRPG